MKARILICCMALLLVTGCLPEATNMQAFSENVTLLSTKVDDYQTEVGEIVDLLEADKIISEDIVAKIDKANEEIDRIQPQIIDVAEAIKDADYISGDDVGNLFRAAKAGTAASAPWNPYAMPILLGLNLLEGVVILLVKRSKDKEANKRQADKEGREKTLREIATLPEVGITAPVVKAMMYSNIGEARRAIT